MNVKDWNQYAARFATLIGNQIQEAHRGVILLPDRRHYAVFGNDGYGSDERTRREVELFRSKLGRWRDERKEVGFGTAAGDVDGTWVMIVEELTDASIDGVTIISYGLTEMLWNAWDEVCGASKQPGISRAFREYQGQIADTAIAEFSEQFDYSTLN